MWLEVCNKNFQFQKFDNIFFLHTFWHRYKWFQNCICFCNTYILCFKSHLLIIFLKISLVTAIKFVSFRISRLLETPSITPCATGTAARPGHRSPSEWRPGDFCSWKRRQKMISINYHITTLSNRFPQQQLVSGSSSTSISIQMPVKIFSFSSLSFFSFIWLYFFFFVDFLCCVFTKPTQTA